MAARTANVIARVEPEVKEKAETILKGMGIPSSVAINMFSISTIKECAGSQGTERDDSRGI